MVLKVLLFAAARQRVGAGAVELEIAMPATIADVRSALVHRFPDIQPLVASSRWAINESFVDDDTAVVGNEEIALIPPVSGG